MEELSAKVRARLRPLVRQTGRRVTRYAGVDTELKRLRRRVNGVAREVAETRRLNRQLDELTTLVIGLAARTADRDDDRVRQRLTEYNQSSF